jgi:hypothetical protein
LRRALIHERVDVRRLLVERRTLLLFFRAVVRFAVRRIVLVPRRRMFFVVLRRLLVRVLAMGFDPFELRAGPFAPASVPVLSRPSRSFAAAHPPCRTRGRSG